MRMIPRKVKMLKAKPQKLAQFYGTATGRTASRETPPQHRIRQANYMQQAIAAERAQAIMLLLGDYSDIELRVFANMLEGMTDAEKVQHCADLLEGRSKIVVIDQ